MSDWLIQPPFDRERDDWGAQLLREWTSSEVKAGTRVLIIGAGAGAVGAALTRTGAQVVFVDDSVAALAMAQKTIEAARATATFITTSAMTASEPFDLALINILWWPDAERGAELIELAAEHVRPGGIIVLAGGKQSGIKGAESLLEKVGPSSTLLYKKGHRLVAVERPPTWSRSFHTPTYATVQVRDMHFELEHAAGVFAGGGLDPATMMLIEAVSVPAKARILDLGCGSGIIGMALKQLEPSAEVVLVDSNSRAVQLARANLARNTLQAEVLESNGISAIQDRVFDLVVTNPPFHVGRMRSEKIAHMFIVQAHQVTASGGQLWLVANQFLRYEPLIQATWGNVEEVVGDSRFKVLRATRRG